MRHVYRSKRDSIFRCIVFSIPRWIVLILSILLGMIVAIAAFFGFAFLFNTDNILFAAAVCAGFLVTTLLVWAVARKTMKWVRSGIIALCVGAGAMLVLGLFTSVTVLRPFPSTSTAKQPSPVPSGVRYWDLGTGSHIAYLEVPAQGKAQATPIILVGGGPGEEDIADTSQTQFFGQLSQLGYDVYFYDQIGSGLSARLNDPGHYTLARQVADLEAIRATIGAQQVILMGASWGGTLTANYMAAYPEHVAKAIFTSPAPINYFEWPNFGSIISRLPASEQQQANQMLRSTHFLGWYLLGVINPIAAHNLVSDQEADAFFNTFLQLVYPGSVCNPMHLPDQVQRGNGFYDNIFTTRNAQTERPKVNPRTILAKDQTPSLILTGSCNYINWAPTWQYRTTLPNSTLLYFPDAGHEIYLDQPALYLTAIRDFLLGTPLPLIPWNSSQPPNTF